MGEDQLEIKNICDSLGIRLIAYSPLGLGMLTGKYTPSNLPRGPRYVVSSFILFNMVGRQSVKPVDIVYRLIGVSAGPSYSGKFFQDWTLY